MGDHHLFFNTDGKVCMPTTRDDIIQKLIYNIYEYNRKKAKDRQAGNLTNNPWEILATLVVTRGKYLFLGKPP